jgi:hypothetical protein
MADDLRPVSAPGCDEIRDSIELLALDALDPAEHARLMTHVEGCAECRAELEQAEASVGSLLRLVPGADADPPAGFTDRVVAARAAAVGPAAEAVAGGPSRSARWIGLAVAGVVVALLVTALGVALGSVFASDGQVAGPPATASPGARSGSLVTADGITAGSVSVDDGTGTLVMVVDTVAPGVAYDCVVRSAAGELVRVGSWTTATGGTARWTVALDPALGSVDQVLLVGPGDATLATAQLT